VSKVLKYLPILIVPPLLAYVSEITFEKLPVFLAISSFVAVSMMAATLGFYPIKKIFVNRRRAMLGFLLLILSAIGLYFLAFFFAYVSGAAYEYGERSFPMWTYSFYMTIPLMIGAVAAVLAVKSVFKIEKRT